MVEDIDCTFPKPPNEANPSTFKSPLDEINANEPVSSTFKFPLAEICPKEA